MIIFVVMSHYTHVEGDGSYPDYEWVEDKIEYIYTIPAYALDKCIELNKNLREKSKLWYTAEIQYTSDEPVGDTND